MDGETMPNACLMLALPLATVEGSKPHEVEPMFPLDDVKLSNKFDVYEETKDVETATPLADSKEFNPFKERITDNPTTDCNTLTHLLKSTLGSGIMTMPCAFKSSGIIGGIFGGLFIAGVCTHTSYILVNCAHVLYYRTHKTKMDYAEVAETAFATGPEWGRKVSKYVNYFIQIWVFATYFGACSADNIIIAKNYGQVISYYTHNVTDVDSTSVPLQQTIMGCLLLPLILFVWVPDLKYLAPISTIANILMACVLGITLYYLVQAPMPISQLSLTRPIVEFPKFYAMTLFAMQNIGVIMPLENNMKTPQNFLGACGVLNRGMFGITLICILIGALGYSKYGANVNSIVTANLPVTEVAAQIVKVLIGSTVLLTFSLQFYVCREMVWTKVRKYFPNRPHLAEYILRAVLVIGNVSLAIAVPTLGPLVELVGALGFSILGILSPVIIEVITFWEIGFGRYNWMVYKNVILAMMGFTALFSGSYLAVEGILKDLSK